MYDTERPSQFFVKLCVYLVQLCGTTIPPRTTPILPDGDLRFPKRDPPRVDPFREAKGVRRKIHILSAFSAPLRLIKHHRAAEHTEE